MVGAFSLWTRCQHRLARATPAATTGCDSDLLAVVPVRVASAPVQHLEQSSGYPHDPRYLIFSILAPPYLCGRSREAFDQLARDYAAAK